MITGYYRSMAGVCAVLPFLLAAVAAATPVAAASTFSPWTSWDRTHGLAENTVQAIATDGAGGLWVGTKGGLGRFDGTRWQSWTTAEGLPDADVHSLAVDGAGRLWVGAGAGFGRLEEGRWSRLGLPGATGAGRLAVASDREGNVWFGHGRGLLRYDPAAGSLEPVEALEGTTVRALLADRAGRLWAATAGGVHRLESGTWTAFGEREGLPPGGAVALLEGLRGEIWCATESGLAQFDGASWRRAGGREGARPGMTSLAEDGEGRLWVGTRAGAGSFDGYDWQWFDARSGLPADEVLALAADANGSVWIGTPRGLARYDTSWLGGGAALRESAGPRAPLCAGRDGSVRAAGDRGFFVIGERTVEEVGERERVDARVRVFHEEGDGDLWVGTDRGLVRWNGRVAEEHQPAVRTETVALGEGAIEARRTVACDRSHGLTGLEVSAIAPDGEGGLWVGTTGGLSRYHEGGWTCLDPHEGPARSRVTALARDGAGRVAAGTPEGLWLLEGGLWRLEGRAAGLPPGAVTALLSDRAGRLWVGTDRGLALPDGDRWEPVRAGRGLVSDRVLALFEDSRGRLWVGTGEGVSFLDGGLWGTFGAGDGLPSPRVSSIAESRGRIWFGTDEGIVAHRPDRAPPDTRIKNPPAGPVGTPFLLLEFAGSDLESPPAALRYSWRLDGGPWSAYAPDPLVTVTDLANGRHVFEVRSLDRELNADPTPAVCAFEVNTGLFDLELVEASFGPLYASLYQFYASDPDFERRPPGRVAIRNKYDRPLRVKVSAYLAELMDFPTDAVATVPPGEVATVPLRIELGERALDLERTETRQLRLALQYSIGGERKESESTHAVTVVEKHGMVWEEPERVGLYVTHLDEAVERFARETVRAFREDERAAIVYDNLLRAMELFDALGAAGVRYVPDPENPYGGILPGRPALDVVRLPRETLRLRTGDCDDLAVLYAALLQNVGIDTALVDVFDHVFVMFDTGLAARATGQIVRDAALVHVDGRGRVWVPVETTLVGGLFGAAWQAGAATLSSRRFAAIEMKEAWRKYAPLRPRAPAPDVAPPPREAVLPLFAEDVRRQEEALTSPELRRLRERVARDPADAAAQNALGVLLARRGYLGQAAARFERVIDLAPGFAGGHGNLGNVLYEQGLYREAVERYEESLRLDERPEVHVELALAWCEIGRFDRARAHYLRAMELDPSLLETGTPGAGAGAAAGGGGR